MASPFARAARAADRVTLRTFGEAVRITPRIKAAGKGHQPDPGRRVGDGIPAVFTKAPAEGRLQGARTGTQYNGMMTVAGAETRLWLPASSLATLGYTPGPPDLVTLTGQTGEPSYALGKPGPDDTGGVSFTLTVEVVS